MPTKAFYDSVRASLFNGTLTATQVGGLNALAAAWWQTAGGLPIEAEAYVLATVYNEQGETFASTAENLSYTAERAHKVWPGKFPTVASALPYEHQPQKLGNHVYAGIIGNGNEASGDGYRYRGRGYSQLTGRANYKQFSALLGIDLLNSPDLALDVPTGAAILVTGMVHGLFTGKKLADYFNASHSDPVHARAIVNGDVAANGQKIAGYWSKFLAALKAGAGVTSIQNDVPAGVPISVPFVSVPAPVAPQPNLLEKIQMNISLFSLLLNLLPVIPMLEQDFELEVKNLASSDDGTTKAIQTLHLLEDASKKLRAALGDKAP